MKIDRFDAVILADGDFPEHEIPLSILHSGKPVVCCDGAADKLLERGISPNWVVGDLDSLSARAARMLEGKLHREEEQETNDLAKAFRFCVKRRWRKLAMLGLSGGREDHTIGNLSYLVDFASECEVNAYTDTGVFTPLLRSCVMQSYPGQAVSLFSFQPGLEVYSEGLRYPLSGVRFDRWWNATLNEATAGKITLTFTGGQLLVFREYPV